MPSNPERMMGKTRAQKSTPGSRVKLRHCKSSSSLITLVMQCLPAELDEQVFQLLALALEALQGPVGEYLPFAHEDDAVAEIFRLLHVMGGEQEGVTTREELADELPELLPGLGIQPRGRLT